MRISSATLVTLCSGLLCAPLTYAQQAPYSVPLYLQPGASYDDNGSTAYYPYRIGVDLLFEGASGPQRYMLDTGSVSLVAGDNMKLGNSVTDTNVSGKIAYGNSGTNNLLVHPASGSVSFYDAGKGANVVTVNSASFVTAYDHEGTVGDWDLTPGASSALEGQYAGILGAGYNQKFFNQSETPDQQFNLFSLLGQVDMGSALPGFSIRINRISMEGVLTIGIDSMKLSQAQYQVAFPAQTIPSPTEPIPNSGGVQPRNQYQINAVATVNGVTVEDSSMSSSLHVLLDTGAPTTEILGVSTPTPDGALPQGTPVAFTADDLNGGDFIYSLMASGVSDPQDLESLINTKLSGAGDFESNIGLNPFLEYEIMFVLNDGSGNSVVALTPVPEPATIAWVAAVGLIAIVGMRRRVR